MLFRVAARFLAAIGIGIGIFIALGVEVLVGKL